MPKLLLKPLEVAEALSLGRTTTFKLINEGAIRSVRIGRSLRVPVDEVERFAQTGKPATGGPTP